MEKKGFFKRVGASIKATVNKGLGIQGAGADGGVAGGNGSAKAVPGGRVRAALRLDAMRYLNAPQNPPPFLSVRISISVIPLLLISALPPLSFGSVDAIPSTEKELFCVFVKLFNMYIFYFHTIFSTT